MAKSPVPVRSALNQQAYSEEASGFFLITTQHLVGRVEVWPGGTKDPVEVAFELIGKDHPGQSGSGEHVYDFTLPNGPTFHIVVEVS